MYHIQSRVTMIDRRYDIQDRITSKQLPLASVLTITNAAIHPLVLASDNKSVLNIHIICTTFSHV